MPYLLKPGRSIAKEITRVVEKQLEGAVAALYDVGDRRSDEAIHEARRHIKKVRAVLRLVRPALGGTYARVDERMRAASRKLAPIADGEAVVDTIARVRKRYASPLPRRTLALIRAGLVEREARIDRRARTDHVLETVVGLLLEELSRVPAWTLDAGGFRALAGGLLRSHRRARKAMAMATARPTAEHYHVWRCRAKTLWFQVRLIEARCRGRLRIDERRLEALDDCLGELHNVALLQRILVREALASRAETARCLRALKTYARALRRRAAVLGAAALNERPRDFVRRVRRAWTSGKSAARRKRAPWPTAA